MPDLHLYTPNISIIILKYNNISQIPAETIIGMKQLRHLNVYSNNLKIIPDLYHSSLEILEIGKNPLCCDESLCWVRLCARKKPAALTVPGKPVCSSPDYIEGKLLMEGDPVKMGCYKGHYEIDFIFSMVGKWKPVFNPWAFLANGRFRHRSTSVCISVHIINTITCQTCLNHIIVPNCVENGSNHIVH